jgi:GntR family transcriptional regulator, transcriptional repressor for pyruvate dehydrogenase complex
MKASESVAHDIVNDVVEGRLGEGDSLPTEAHMLAQYGVSRESLREGLRLLETQGLITLRRGPGGGPVLGSVDPANLGRTSTLYYHLVGATYGELFEAWAVAEGYLAERAARNADRALVRSTLGAYLQPDGAEFETLDELVAHHVRFHTEVGTLAGNRVMQMSLMAIGQTVVNHITVAADQRDASATLLDDHQRIASSIVAGRPIKSRDQMRSHIEAVAQLCERLSGGAILTKLIEWR